MNYESFLNRIIDDGIEAAKQDYKNHPHKSEGAVAGFEACRGKNPLELAELLLRAQRIGNRAHSRRGDVKRYWRLRCFELEVEWVCNVLSSRLQTPIIPCTARGYMKAAEILGVSALGTV